MVQDLLILLLSAFAAEYGPILIILEDLHLFDTVSLQLVADTAKTLVHGCLVIASMRPNAGIFKPANNNQVSSDYLFVPQRPAAVKTSLLLVSGKSSCALIEPSSNANKPSKLEFLQAERRILHQKAASALREIQLSHAALSLSLQAFTQDEIETLVTAVLDQEPTPKRLARVIWDITAGWPLYAEQVSCTILYNLNCYTRKWRSLD